jgi:hypothetical protein
MRLAWVGVSFRMSLASYPNRSVSSVRMLDVTIKATWATLGAFELLSFSFSSFVLVLGVVALEGDDDDSDDDEDEEREDRQEDKDNHFFSRIYPAIP